MKIFEKIKEKILKLKDGNYIVEQKQKKLVNLIDDMAGEYYRNHKKYFAKNKKLNRLMKSLFKTKKKSTKSVNKLDQMMEKRHFDYIVSGLLEDAKKIELCKKCGNTEKIENFEKNYNQSYSDLRSFLTLEESNSDEETKLHSSNPEFIKRIKSPIDNDDTLKTIINVYSKYNPKEESFYGALVKWGEENTESNYEAYKKFRNNIYKKELETIMLKSDEELEENRKARFKMNIKLKLYKLRKPYIILKYGKRAWRQIKHTGVDSYYLPEKEIKALVSKYGVEEIFELYDELHKKQEDVRNGKYKYTKDEAQIIKLIDHYLISRHKFYGLLGFFAHNEKGEYIDEKSKLYINAESKDIYRLAEMFVNEVEKAGLKYHLKVIDGEYDNPKRSEKLVIYAELDDLEKYVKILEKIKRENPDLKVKNPPCISGNIDNWIGIGADPRDDRGSYNQLRSTILKKAIKKTFSEVPKEQLSAFVEAHPEKIGEFRKNIIDICQENNIPKDYFFFEQNCVDYFKGEESVDDTKKEVTNEKINTQRVRHYDKSKVSTVFDSKEQQAEMDRVLDLINQGKSFDSEEMKELFKQIAEERAKRIKAENNTNIIKPVIRKSAMNKKVAIGEAR